MKIANFLTLTGLSVLLVAGLSACEKPGPAEKAGKQMDQAVEEASQKINNSADKAAMELAEQSRKGDIAVNDAEITTKVKAAIFAEPGLHTLQISVETLKGKVTLTGSVDSPANSEMAKSLASAVNGVNDVNNLLSIKPKK
jgi:osmotically-inducible protein OsmY